MFKFLCREKVNILGFSIVGLVLGFITILVYERGILYWSVFCNVVFGVSLVFASGNNNAVQSIYEFRFKHVIIPILFLSIIWFGSVHLMHLIHPLLS